MKKFKRKVLAMLMTNNFGSSLRQQLFDGAPFCSELLYTAIPQRAASGTTGTFTRATTSTWPNNDGYLVTGAAGEIGFVGARRVRNLLTFTEDFSNAVWDKYQCTAPVNVVVGPTGRVTNTLTADANGGQHAVRQNVTVISGNTIIWSVYVKAGTASWVRLQCVSLANANCFFNISSGAVGTAVGCTGTIEDAGGGWYRCSIKGTTSATSGFNQVELADGDNDVNSVVSSGLTAYIGGAQLEDVTAQTTQTAGEYVSVGVPSDWAGDELATNGTFDTDTTWNKEVAQITISGGTAVFTACAADKSLYKTSFGFSPSQNYICSFDIPSISAGGVYLSCAGVVVSGVFTTAGTKIVTFTTAASLANDNFNIISSGASTTCTVDNVSLKPAYYHGSFVDGVKCFNTDLAGNPLPTAYTYDAVSLNGVAGTYVSTPDSVAASVTGSSRFEWVGSIYDYNMTNTLLSKWNVGAYLLRISAAKKVLFNANGTNSVSITSTASVPFNNGDDNVGVKVEVVADNGAGGSTTSIYTTIDGGETWDLLESATVTAGVLSIADTTDAVMVGNYGTTSGQLAGKTYRARIYNNGTLAVDFDASRYAGGTTLTGSTGETWTLQGNAVIHPTNIPMLGYQAQGARTNLCLQSNAFTTTWTNSPALSTLSQNVIGPDGAVSAWTCADTDAANTSRLYQSITLTAAAYTASLFVKKTSGATSFPVIALVTGTVYGLATLDTNNGVATAWTANGYGTTLSGVSARCSSFNSDFWRFELTATGTAAAYTYQLYPAGTTNATQSTGDIDATAQGSAVFYGAQVEPGSFASSYIATTTAAARNADVLAYSGGDIPNLKTLCATFRRESGVASTGVVLELDDGGGLAYNAMYLTSATNLRFEGRTTGGGGAIQWQVNASNAYTPGASSKSAVSAATNDIKMAFSGVAQTADTSATLSPFTQLSVGYSGGTGGLQLSGNVGGIYGWTRNLSQSEENAVTA